MCICLTYCLQFRPEKSGKSRYFFLSREWVTLFVFQANSAFHPYRLYAFSVCDMNSTAAVCGLWRYRSVICLCVCVATVLKLESASTEHGPRYVVHCVQSVPERAFRTTQFDKYITLPEHGSTTLSFSVIVCD